MSFLSPAVLIGADSSGGQTFGSGSTDCLDLLAEIASREFIKVETEETTTQIKEEPVKIGKRRRSQNAAVANGIKKRLVDYDEFDVNQIKRMSLQTLLRMFSEQDFDEVAKRFRYKCALLPHQCQETTQSFGSENKAKAQMKKHLQQHVKAIADNEEMFREFTAESVSARRRRMEKMEEEERKGDYKSEMMLQGIKAEDEVKPAIEMMEHDYFSPFPGKTKKIKTEDLEEEDHSKTVEDNTSQLVKAVIEAKKSDINLADFVEHDFAQASSVIGAEITFSSSEKSEISLVPNPPENEPPKPFINRRNKAIKNGSSRSATNENLSPEQALLRKKAFEAIAELKAQGSNTDDFRCKLCTPSRKFTAYTTLLSHLRSHAGVRPYECCLCHQPFTRQHSLNYHMLIHQNETRFTCSDCGRKFRHPSHFKEHRRKHTGESPYECRECAIRYKTRNTYKRHLKVFHGKVLTPSGGLSSLPSEEFRKIQAQELKKEKEKMEKRRRKQMKSEEVKEEETSDLIHDNESLLVNDDEEVAGISQQLEEREAVLNGTTRIRLDGSIASSVGTLCASTDSEFSSPEPETKKESNSPPLPIFGCSPPKNLVSSAPKSLKIDRESLEPRALKLQNQEKSPNLLENASKSAFNPFKKTKKTVSGNGKKSKTSKALFTKDLAKKTAVVQAPLKVNQPVMPKPANVALPPNKAILANIDGKQVWLIPTSDQKKASDNAEGTSKLEQCLRYGSAAAMSNPAVVSTPNASASIVVSSSAPLIVPQPATQVAPQPVGHTFVLSQPINLIPNASTAVSSVVPSSLDTAISRPVTKINSIRLVPVVTGASAVVTSVPGTSVVSGASMIAGLLPKPMNLAPAVVNSHIKMLSSGPPPPAQIKLASSGAPFVDNIGPLLAVAKSS